MDSITVIATNAAKMFRLTGDSWDKKKIVRISLFIGIFPVLKLKRAVLIQNNWSSVIHQVWKNSHVSSSTAKTAKL